jgi:hypothetical protein
MNSLARTRAGAIAYYTNVIKYETWREAQRNAEKDFYTNILTIASAAKAAATRESTGVAANDGGDGTKYTETIAAAGGDVGGAEQTARTLLYSYMGITASVTTPATVN